MEARKRRPAACAVTWANARDWGWRATLAFAALTGAVWLLVAAYVVNPVREAGDAIGLSPASPEVAVSLCRKPQTQITLVNSPGDRYYVATWEEPGLRYDLTWRADGDSIAVEKLRGRDFDLWAEQISPEFLNCVSNKPVTVREVIH